MRFKEVIGTLINKFTLNHSTTINSEFFKINTTNMEYVNFVSCRIDTLSVQKGQDILLQGAFIQTLMSPNRLNMDKTTLFNSSLQESAEEK